MKSNSFKTENDLASTAEGGTRKYNFDSQIFPQFDGG